MSNRPISILLGAVFGFAASGLAFAADLEVKAPAPAPVPVYTWTGFYVGLNAGGHWDHNSISAAPDPVGFEAEGVDPAILSTIIGTGASVHPDGFIGGGQIGYNWQTSFLVFGVEADAQGLTGQASPIVTPLTSAGSAPGDFVSNSARPEFLATFRGRIGVAPFGGPNSALFYATGGGVWGTVKVTDTFGALGGTSISSATATENRTGWTAGGGIEIPLINNLTFKAEYLYVDLGHFNQTTAPIVSLPATDITFNHHYTENIVRAGLNYQFH